MNNSWVAFISGFFHINHSKFLLQKLCILEDISWTSTVVLYENSTSICAVTIQPSYTTITCAVTIQPSYTTCKRVFLNEATQAYQYRYVYNTNRRSHV